MGYGGGMAAKLLDKPLVLEVNGDHLTEMKARGNAPEGFQRWLSKKLTRSAVLRSTFTIATGEGWRNKLMERWGVDPSRVCVVENGSEFVDLLSRNQLRAFSSPSPQDALVQILYVGSLEPWHGIEILLRAVSRMISKKVNFHLNLIGTGSEQHRIASMVQEQGLNSWVSLKGQLSSKQLSTYLAQADIGVAPYCGRVEYSGLKLIDYKAAGLVAIASGKNGHPKVIEHGKSGWIVPPCDEVALSDAIIHIAKERALRVEIGKKARIEAEQRHSWRHTVQELTNIFKSITERRYLRP
jgi:glycosyltransferase involved in cell wall biosynthesis